ncbi:MAG: flavodoxin-dependent (E)-4-hydroxy-3-methylbut-2-enyl-diphosphate synthase, partial [Elusimicrobiaceae bacterium]|nr:flavodoxin-dependent (E)-4-hydroxy-3-methylbut-2-enyl-diphosphate synthase [Elusimicrobiaceae bacterium]
MYKTREVKVGPYTLGTGHPVRVQSMCNTDTHNAEQTAAQICALEEAGCEINRVAVPDMDAAQKIGEIKKRIHSPLVADIHFDYKLALEAIKQGVDKVRINPGNIGAVENTKEVVRAAADKGVAI